MNPLDFPDIEWGNAHGLVSAIRAVDEKVDTVWSEIRAPTNELTTTVMTTRACALGARVGRNFYHHEGRAIVQTSDALAPEISVSEAGHDPRWDFGLLVAPKYFSFFQDAPFAAYHPNHRAKWRSHEMLHGAVGFFWRPDMTRFEAYLGARLNELLPVAHWYYFDEIDRPRCPDHRGKIPTHLCANCDDLGSYWTHDVRRDDAVDLARLGFEHVDSELAACIDELHSGYAIDRITGSGLNPSSDAIAYMRAHWARLTAYSFGFWAERFLRPGRDYFETVSAFSENVDRNARELVSGSIGLGATSVACKRRALQDLAYRFLYMCDSYDIDETPFLPELDQLASAIDGETMAEMNDAFDRFRDRVQTDGQSVVVLLDGIDAHDADLVEAGLQSVSDDPVEHTDKFVESEFFFERGTVAERYDRFLSHTYHDQTWRMAASVCALPRVDLEGERFAGVPSRVVDLDTGRLRVNDTIRVIDETSVGYHFLGTFRVVAKNESTDRIIGAVQDERVELETIDVPTLIEFVEQGLVFWFPDSR